MARLKVRDRPEERTMPLSYLQDIHQRHEEWLIDETAK